MICSSLNPLLFISAVSLMGRTLLIPGGNPAAQTTDPAELLRPAATGTVRIWPVSTRVNKTANNDAALLEPVI